jgi:DNA-directed RNA polymerase sigma subunit (sigma70/sigma32)
MGRAPTFDATCDAIGLPKGERACLSFALATLRENAQVRPEDIATEDERLDEVEAKARDLETLGRMLAQLDPEARDLIADRWGLGGRKPMTLGQAGKARNRSAERIRQREVAAMQRLRQLAEGEQLCASA